MGLSGFLRELHIFVVKFQEMLSRHTFGLKSWRGSPTYERKGEKPAPNA